MGKLFKRLILQRIHNSDTPPCFEVVVKEEIEYILKGEKDD